MDLSKRIRHFFHVVSNVRPIVWICTYVALTPVFALIYWGLPDGQFRIPDNSGTDFGSWLYYSIVTITTLGFGDYTPAQGWAQAVTAVEVMCGLVILGFFLNAVGSMKSEIEVDAEIERQRLAHEAEEKRKLTASAPILLSIITKFLDVINHISLDHIEKNTEAEIRRVVKAANRTSLALDSLQQRVDLTLFPDLVDDCFAFVGNCQLFAADESGEGSNTGELIDFIKTNRQLAMNLQHALAVATN